MIYISHYDSTTCWVARCFKICNRSLPYWKLSYVSLYLLSWRTTGCWATGPAVNRVILRLCIYILIGNKTCISPADTIFVKSCHICRLVYPYNAIFKTKISLGPVVNRSSNLSYLIALRTGDIKIMASRRPLQVPQRIFISQVKLKSKLSLKTLDLHLLLSSKKFWGSM